jgi:hypothetical protein
MSDSLQTRKKQNGKMYFNFTKLSRISNRIYFKGTVQRELRWVKIGINRTAMKIWIAGKCRLSCVKKYYSRQLRLSSSCDGVPWGMVNDTCRQYSLSLRFD